jgi:hypothetical protein
MTEQINIDISDKNSCSICLTDEIESNNHCITNCNHEFCKDCLSNWFNQGKDSCPICREQIINYKNNNKDYNLIRIIQNNQEEISVNRIPVLLLIQNLIKANAKLKCYSYATTVWLLYSLNQLLSYYTANNSIQAQLLSCQDNFTELQNDIYNSEYKNVLMIEEKDEDYIRECRIPTFFYDKCFF